MAERWTFLSVLTVVFLLTVASMPVGAIPLGSVIIEGPSEIRVGKSGTFTARPRELIVTGVPSQQLDVFIDGVFWRSITTTSTSSPSATFQVQSPSRGIHQIDVYAHRGDPQLEARGTFLFAGIVPPSKPENISISAVENKVTLTWSPPLDDGGSPITGYEVSVRGSFGPKPSLSDPTLRSAVQYGYLNYPVSMTVFARNNAGSSPADYHREVMITSLPNVDSVEGGITGFRACDIRDSGVQCSDVPVNSTYSSTAPKVRFGFVGSATFRNGTQLVPYVPFQAMRCYECISLLEAETSQTGVWDFIDWDSKRKDAGPIRSCQTYDFYRPGIYYGDRSEFDPDNVRFWLPSKWIRICN